MTLQGQPRESAAQHAETDAGLNHDTPSPPAPRLRPRRIRLEATSVCQLRCPACPTASGAIRPALGTGHLRASRFRQLIESDPGIMHIELSNYGELFLNPELEEILECAFHRGVRLTADNGANFNTVRLGTIEALVKFSLHRLTCSIDGATPETYARYRVGGDLRSVLANIEELNRYKKQYASPYPRLTWQFVVFPHNRHEIDAARRLAAKLGMRFCEKLSWEAPEPGAASRGTRDEYKARYGVDYARGICSQLWRTPQINWDGRVLGCCRNFWGHFEGNAFDEGIEAVSNHERIRYARSMLVGERPARSDVPCSTCDLYLAMQENGRFLAPLEWELPAAVQGRLHRSGFGHRMVLTAVGAFFRVAEDVHWRFLTLTSRARVRKSRAA